MMQLLGDEVTRDTLGKICFGTNLVNFWQDMFGLLYNLLNS